MLRIKDRSKTEFILALMYFVIAILFFDFFLMKVHTEGVWEWFLTSLFLFLFAPLALIKFVFRGKVGEYNLSFRFSKKTLLFSLAGLLVYVALAGVIVIYFEWNKYIPISRWALGGTSFLLFVDLALTPFVLFAKEFLFRGYILKSAMPILGIAGAIFLQAILNIFLDAYLTSYTIAWQQVVLMFITFSFLGYIAWQNKSVIVSFLLVWVHVLLRVLFIVQ